MLKRGNLIKTLLSVGLMTLVFGCASTQKHESTGEYLDDTVITTKVKAAILNEPTLKVLQISVKSFKGVVQLSGFVDSAQNSAKAGDVAARVTGVTEVNNNLNVK